MIHERIEVPHSPPCVLSAIMLPPILPQAQLFDKIFSTTLSNPWLLIGDFNDFLTTADKFGGLPPNIFRMQNFANCINTCNLLEIETHVPRYTSGLILEKLDLGFC